VHAGDAFGVIPYRVHPVEVSGLESGVELGVGGEHRLLVSCHDCRRAPCRAVSVGPP
jgi:hypothetical protein